MKYHLDCHASRHCSTPRAPKLLVGSPSPGLTPVPRSRRVPWRGRRPPRAELRRQVPSEPPGDGVHGGGAVGRGGRRGRAGERGAVARGRGEARPGLWWRSAPFPHTLPRARPCPITPIQVMPCRCFMLPFIPNHPRFAKFTPARVAPPPMPGAIPPPLCAGQCGTLRGVGRGAGGVCRAAEHGAALERRPGDLRPGPPSRPSGRPPLGTRHQVWCTLRLRRKRNLLRVWGPPCVSRPALVRSRTPRYEVVRPVMMSGG